MCIRDRLDRLSNPRPAFHVTRVLNTVLFGEGRRPGSYTPVGSGGLPGAADVRVIKDRRAEFWLVPDHEKPRAAEALRQEMNGHETHRLIDPVGGVSWQASARAVADLLASKAGRPLWVIQFAEAHPISRLFGVLQHDGTRVSVDDMDDAIADGASRT